MPLFTGVAAPTWTAIILISHVLAEAAFVATPKRLVCKIVALAGIHPDERIYDLSCGDGF